MLKAKTNKLSSEIKTSLFIIDSINEVISSVSRILNDSKCQILLSKFPLQLKNVSINKSDNIKLAAYLILESLWLYYVIVKNSKNTSFKKPIFIKNNLIDNIKILSQEYGFSIFSLDLINEISQEIIDKMNLTITKIEDDYGYQKNTDIRGLIFQKLLPEQLRKVFGTYHTRSEALKF